MKLTIQEFKKQCKRTCPSLEGGIKLDLSHMALGMGSELNELDAAYNKADTVNISEELADFLWYFCNYLTFREIQFNFEDVLLTQRRFCVREGIEDLFFHTTVLQDYTKKFIAYNKSIPLSEELKTLKILFSLIVAIYREIDIDMEESLYKNIEKLKLRFPDKFSEDLAINRDVEAERKILEYDFNPKTTEK